MGPTLEDTYYTNRELSLRDSYWYYVTKVINGVESSPSNIVFARVGSIEIYIPNLRVAPGTRSRIQVAFSSAYNVLGSALTLWVDYPENLAVYKGWEKSPILSSFQYPVPNTAEGVFRLAGVDFAGQLMVGEGRVLELLVDVPQTAVPGTQATISFERATLYDPDIAPLDVVPQAGTLTVSGTYILGDVNGDGLVDAGDALAAGWLAVQRTNFPGFKDPESYLAGDVNADRIVDSADVILVLRLASGYSINPPQGPGKATYLQDLASAPAVYHTELSSGRVVSGGSVTLSISSPDLAQVAGGSFILTYDPSVLQYQQVAKGSLADSKFWSLVAQDAPGILRISTGGRENVPTGGGEIARITFGALSEYSLTTPLLITQARLARQYGERVEWTSAVTKGSGIVTVVSSGFELWDLNQDGRIDYLDVLLMGLAWRQPHKSNDLLQMIDGFAD